ncbi:MAG: hypothetical protein A2W85_01760 [Bacteroidetes bacterium GWF2_41_31]|nr:MAG: hypothetical protein A2W85_01760 [Bacteroidetes bacterium GWF2_41_31]
MNLKNIIKLSPSHIASMSNDWYALTDPNHFWFRWRFKILHTLLKPLLSGDIKILEIGCGDGTVMKQFYDHLGVSIDGCDINSFALKNINYKIPGNVYQYDIFELHPLLIDKYDVVLLLDVIEHIDNVNEFISAALKHLKNNGIIIVGVPAYQWLYSNYDLELGHYRRYNRSQIKQLFIELELDIIETKYWGLSMIPLLLIRKYYLKMNRKNIVEKGFGIPHPLFNKLALHIMNLETMFIKNPISGSSLFAIAQKKVMSS